MNIFIQLLIVTGLLSSLCVSSSVRTIALIPKGLRACLPNERGLESFTFYGYIRGSGSRPVRTRLEGEVREPSDGLWCYQNRQLPLNIGDELVYWYRVVKFGTTTQSETITKKLQAADFLDESGLYAHRTETPSAPCRPSEGHGCSSTADTNYSGSSATNFPVTPITSRPDNYMFSWLRPNNGAEIQIAQPLRPGHGVSTAALNPPEKSTRPQQSINIGEGVRKLCQTSQKNGPAKYKDFAYAPFPPLDVAPQGLPSEGGVFHENPSPKIDVRLGDSIHIEILLERNKNPCDEQLSDPGRIAEIDDRIRAEFFSKLNTLNQSCTNMIGLEKKFSEAIMSSLSESVLKVNTLEHNLADANTEVRYYKKIVKELLTILDSLRGGATNKLILQSSVPLVDYRKTLRDVLEIVIEIKPESYHIVKSDVEKNKTISFELSNYGEKLQIYLAGRIKLENSRFEMFDFDILSELQKKN